MMDDVSGAGCTCTWATRQGSEDEIDLTIQTKAVALGRLTSLGGFGIVFGMGKVYRRKRRSCAMCKPNKMGGEPARTPRELMEAQQAEKEIRRALRRPVFPGSSIGRAASC